MDPDKKKSKMAPTGVGRSVSHSSAACFNCKKKKVKCDGNLPCDRCVRAKIQCQYSKSMENFIRQRDSMLQQQTEREENDDEVSAAAAAGGNTSRRRRTIEDSEVLFMDDSETDGRSTKSTTTHSHSLIEEEGDHLFDYMAFLKRKSDRTGDLSKPLRMRDNDNVAADVTNMGNEGGGQIVSAKDLPWNTSPCLAAEIVLADSATASFLMSIFTSRILPHYMATHSLPDPSFFLSSFEQPASVAAAMQRDGALALACRNAGHEALAKLLIGRMDRMADVVKEHFSTSYEGFSSFVLYYLLTVGENAEKSFAVSQGMLSMRKYVFGDQDIMEGVCSAFAELDLSSSTQLPEGGGGIAPPIIFNNNNSNNSNSSNSSGSLSSFSSADEDISQEEIEAHVRFAVEQSQLWIQTIQDFRMKMFVILALELKARLTVPILRPASVMFMTLVIDMQLLGLIIPPYLADVMQRHDPQGQFGFKAFLNPTIPINQLPEPPVLSPEIYQAFLRRVQVTRKLLRSSHVLIPTMRISLESFHTLIHLRSANLAEALRVARQTMGLVASHDPNFWPPLVLQHVFAVASVFYEAQDIAGLDQVAQVMLGAQRSIPAARLAVSMLLELRSNLMKNSSGNQ